jgi:hypothetical protein
MTCLLDGELLLRLGNGLILRLSFLLEREFGCLRKFLVHGYVGSLPRQFDLGTLQLRTKAQQASAVLHIHV